MKTLVLYLEIFTRSGMFLLLWKNNNKKISLWTELPPSSAVQISAICLHRDFFIPSDDGTYPLGIVKQWNKIVDLEYRSV